MNEPQPVRRCRRGAIADRTARGSAPDARGFIQEVDRAFIGKHPAAVDAVPRGRDPFLIRSKPPTLGEHNREIPGGMLGLSDAELEQLTRDGSPSGPRC